MAENDFSLFTDRIAVACNALFMIARVSWNTLLLNNIVGKVQN